jgi:predicted ATP-grasp superfamily ATP-dependent carboligase
MSSKYGPCILQEYIQNGGEFGVYTLFDFNSNPIGLTVHKRIRSVYSYGGMSTLRRTVKNEEITDIAFKLLKGLKWSGVAMVEFRIDPIDGIPKLIEINPRLWGSLQLSILSGVDFPYLLYQLTMQDHPTSTMNYQKDIECRWLGGDITGFFNCSNKSKMLINFFKFNTNFDVISLRDIKPGFISIFFPVTSSCDEEPRDDSPIINSEMLIP